MKLAIIAAIGNNRVIGKDGKLPWHISGDLRRFKQLTTGHAVLMGRKTFESIGKPLPHRRNVVVTSHQIPNVETYSSIDDAMKALAGEEKVFIIGGGQMYARFLGLADELYLTFVDTTAEGDTLFPPYKNIIDSAFRLISEESHEGYRFCDYHRVA